MLQFRPDLLRSFTVFDVTDPDELGDDSRVSQRFPLYNKFNTYRLRDRGVTTDRLGGPLSRMAVRREGALTMSYVGSRPRTDVGIVGDGVQRLFLTFCLYGEIALQAGRTDEAVASGSRRMVYRGRAGTRLLTSEHIERMTIQIDEARLHRTLESLLDRTCPDCPTFVPSVDWVVPSLAPIVRMSQHLLEEAGDPSGLFSLKPALETFTDTLTHLILDRLPHDYTEQLHAPGSPAIPRQLRRAEAFMAAHAGQPISVLDIAAAAGCSARALQLAFRQFRHTTPLAALRDTRLHAARAAIVAAQAPVSVIAREFGFSNATRFRAMYTRRFSEMPAETPRRHS